MSESTHIEALVRAHAHGDDAQFYSVALGCAARLVRSGDAEAGTSLRDVIDKARARMDLPPFSGKPTACRKCEYCPLDESVVTDRYAKEGGAEFLERTCRNCGYVRYEQCANSGDPR